VAEPTLRSDAASAAQCQSTVARQAIENNRLRQRQAEARPVEELLAAFATAAAAGTIGAPVSHARVMQMIVETAAGVIGARSAALLRLDATSGKFVFDVALGPKAEEVKHHRVPLGHGIAGLAATLATQTLLPSQDCAVPDRKGRCEARFRLPTTRKRCDPPRGLVSNETKIPGENLFGFRLEVRTLFPTLASIRYQTHSSRCVLLAMSFAHEMDDPWLLPVDPSPWFGRMDDDNDQCGVDSNPSR
jgi:hypothetical protein